MTSDDSELRLPRRTIAIILAGGRGSRLHELTDRRAKPAVPFGGKYRIVDFALSNAVNSGIRRIYVMTQYKAHSLIRHIQRGWSHVHGHPGEFVDLLPAQQRVDESMWYRGTADAVWQNLDILKAEAPEYVLVLAGDHVYKQDYGIMIRDHVRRGARVTVGCVTVPRAEASAFGVMAVDGSNRVVRFLEKPSEPPALPDDPEHTLASMGIYVFGADFLWEELSRDALMTDSAHDFGRDFLPRLVQSEFVLAHRLRASAIVAEGQTEPYWRDVGTLDAYWQANLGLTDVTPALDLYDRKWPVFTLSRGLPPAKFVFDDDGRRGVAVDSLVSAGCIVSGASVRRTMLGSRVHIETGATLDEAVVLPEARIGRNARLRRVVIDSRCVIPDGLVVGEDADADRARFRRSEGGVTLITPPMLERL
jgi:glucose-1-phosphate adenylyltransferase